jgi:hypothetical protein
MLLNSNLMVNQYSILPSCSYPQLLGLPIHLMSMIGLENPSTEGTFALIRSAQGRLEKQVELFSWFDF